MFRTIATTVALGLAVCACNAQGGVTDPKVGSGVASPTLDSGITSSNGGGTRALGNQPGVSVGGAPRLSRSKLQTPAAPLTNPGEPETPFAAPVCGEGLVPPQHGLKAAGLAVDRELFACLHATGRALRG